MTGEWYADGRPNVENHHDSVELFRTESLGGSVTSYSIIAA